MQDWLSTMLGVVAGGALTTTSSWLADRRLTARDRERRREEREERFALRRNDFQRDTLLALQIASQKLLRATGAMNHQDVMEFRKTGKWQKQQLPEGLSDEHLRQITETMLLASRVLDDETRRLAEALRGLVASACRSANASAAEASWDAAVDTQQALVERVGFLVREMDIVS